MTESNTPDQPELTLNAAFAGECGEAAQRIVFHGYVWLQMLIEKNQDYGCSVWEVPVLTPSLDPGDAILVRMSDKIRRIQTLMTRPPEVVTESLADSIADLGAYCLLYLARPTSIHDSFTPSTKPGVPDGPRDPEGEVR